MEENILEFNAEKARSSHKSESKLIEILTDIKKSSYNDYCHYVYEDLDDKIIEELRKRNFKVSLQPKASIEKNNYFYKITWEA